MAVLLTKLGRTELARSYYRDILNENDIFNFAVGKSTAWADDQSPDAPIDSGYHISEFKRNTMFLQRVTSADICLLAKRIDWVSGVVFDQYDHAYSPAFKSNSGASTLSDATFYVITNEDKVYKCLDNNGGAASTVKPTSVITSAFELSDGYTWKFLFQISASDKTRFYDAEHIPVRKLTGNPDFDVNGELDNITVTDGGSGYTVAPDVVIQGDGIGATATATVVAGVVTAVTITAAGSGYTFGFVAFAAVAGSGAKATVQLGDVDTLPALQIAVEGSVVQGTVDRIEVTAVGQDYSDNDAYVEIVGDGAGAQATLTIAPITGTITAITVTDPGSGYTWANVNILNVLGIGTNAGGRTVISSQGGHGSHAPRELFATTLGLTVTLSDNTNADLILGNDFRQIGLVKNIFTYDNTAVQDGLTSTASFIINVDSNSDYSNDDELVTNDGGQFTVAQIVKNLDDVTWDVYLTAHIPLITIVSEITNNTKGTPSLTINSLTNPEVDMTTGSVVYLENRSPIIRSSDQVETIKALIKF